MDGSLVVKVQQKTCRVCGIEVEDNVILRDECFEKEKDGA
jgi:hypothetical protein